MSIGSHSRSGLVRGPQRCGTPLLVVRGHDGEVRAFRNACRHRGMKLADGSGCAKAFVCGYHGWAYRLDGALQHVPHDHGFPDLDKASHGLVRVGATEHGGIVFVNQGCSHIERTALAEIPALLSDTQQVFATKESVTNANWKLSMEGNLEGYHIKPTHKTSFYPYGYDNLTVVETFGHHSRVTFPFRRIEKLRAVAPELRKIDGMVTYVYHLFPNVIVAILSNHTTLSILEPLSPTQTRFHTYRLDNPSPAGGQIAHEKVARDATFVSDTGGKEDAAVIRGIQDGIASGANDHFTYGLFEQAIVHFHQTLHAQLN
ncbi:MAG: aromatic ring-hydroxylating dioxygenase subunit alpha [Gammaproteobacteria bacterium]|nr:aromatic ring-hydroxylating dioxygenase subunit alpha [Gammaproteobacteria bacterium]